MKLKVPKWNLYTVLEDDKMTRHVGARGTDCNPEVRAKV